MTKVTAAFLALAFSAAIPGMALADCPGHNMTTTSNPATVVDGSGTTAVPPATPIPATQAGG